MTKSPFSRLLLSVALGSAFAVTGCDVRTEAESQPASTPATPILSGSTAFMPGTYPIFSIPTATLPTVTDLPFLVAASTLGTSFDGTALVANATDPVRAAMNDLDGWSTDAFLDIKFSGSIDPASVSSSGLTKNVFLVKLDTTGGDPLDPESIIGVANPSPAYTHTVLSLDGGTNNVVRIIPTTPLDPAAKYLVFLTNGITTPGAVPTTESENYHALSEAGLEVINPALAGVSDWLQGAETIAGSMIATAASIPLATARQMVTVSYTFTTTDPHKPLIAMAAPRAALVSNGATVLQATGLDGAGVINAPKARTVGINPATAIDLGTLTGQATNNAYVYTGHITVPYYQSAPASAADYTYLTKMWRANTTLASQLGVTLPQDVSQTGSAAPVADGTTNVTWRYPFAAQTGNETIPLQVTLPDPNHNPPAPGGTKCEDIYPNGYPVAIYVHGITSDRSSVAVLAYNLAKNACIATVAIDLPVHGIDSRNALKAYLNVDHTGLSALYPTELHERHYDITANASGAPAAMDFTTPNAYDKSGSLFINLSTIGNTRDNLRQAVLDLLNLNASLGNIAALDLDGNAQPDIDVTKVNVIGVSLGGIVGSVFTAVNQAAIAQDMGAGFTPNLNSIDTLLVSAGGSQLTQILMNSPTFAPVIGAGLTAAGAGANTSNRETFLTVAQATVDSGDPVNFGALLNQVNVPTLVQMIVGGGDTTALADSTTWLTDQVVPNCGTATFPLMGTQALANLAGASVAADGAAVSATSNNLLVKLAIGNHTSLLIPNAATAPAYTNGEGLATQELQTEAISLILSGGAGIAIGTTGPGGIAATYTLP